MEDREYSSYTVRMVDRRYTYGIYDNEETARRQFGEAQRENPETNWAIIEHKHIIRRLV